MRVAGGIAGLAGLAMAVLTSAPAQAQSVSDFRLPEASPSAPNTRAQGPVDRDAPTVAAPAGASGAAPRALPSVSPVIAADDPLLAPGASQPAPRATQPTRPAPAAQRPPATGQPVSTDGAGTPPTVPDATGFGLPTPAPSATAPAGPSLNLPIPSASPAASPADSGAAAWWLPWVAGFAALLALVFAVLWWRQRREAAVPAITFEPPVVRDPQPAPAPAAGLMDTPVPIPESAPAPPAAAPAAALSGLGLELEARRLNASLMATTLSYRLVLTNHGALPIAGLAIEGDMVAAHASLPPEQQVAQPAQKLELRHALVQLEPGESIEFIGDIRLPLSAVTPIRAGNAAYFVPLARFRVEGGEPGGRPVVIAQTFVVGEQPEIPGAALRPFRLDLGPRTYSRVGQRLVN